MEGWNRGDGEACARPFADGAEFTAITGLRAEGRKAIARGHQEILSTVFRGTRLTSTVNIVRFLRPDVAVADVTLRLDGGPHLPGQSALGVVATKDEGVWSIAVFRKMIPFDRPVAGPLERELLGKDRRLDNPAGLRYAR